MPTGLGGVWGASERCRPGAARLARIVENEVSGGFQTMRKMLMATVLAGATMLTPGLSSPAQASHDWLEIGTVFRVGAAHIAFAFGRSGYGYEPAYYYRYDRPIHYRDHHCSRSCFHEAGYTYHHESCPVVVAHFSHHRIDRRWAHDHYAPRYRGHGSHYRGDSGYRGQYDRRPSHGYDSHRSHGRYDRHDRDSRYDRNSRDSRHDRNGRYDRNSRDSRSDRNGRYDRNSRNDRSRRDHSRNDRSRGDSRGGRDRDRRHH